MKSVQAPLMDFDLPKLSSEMAQNGQAQDLCPKLGDFPQAHPGDLMTPARTSDSLLK